MTNDDVYFDCINCEEEMPEAERDGNCRTCGGPLCLKCGHVTDCDTCSDSIVTPLTESQLKLRFGRNLKIARKAAGLTQAQLAEMTGYIEGDIERMETGDRFPTLMLQTKMNKALDISDTDLLGE